MGVLSRAQGLLGAGGGWVGAGSVAPFSREVAVGVTGAGVSVPVARSETVSSHSWRMLWMPTAKFRILAPTPAIFSSFGSRPALEAVGAVEASRWPGSSHCRGSSGLAGVVPSSVRPS